MNITIHKQKSARGRITGYSAHNDVMHAEGNTPAEAKANLDKDVINCLGRLARGPIMNRWNNHNWIVWPTIEGWAYWIDTFSIGYYIAGIESKERAVESAMHHLAQSIWELSCADDDEFLRGLPDKSSADLKHWIKWQRSYAALKAQGKTDNEAHQMASGF